MTKAELQAQIEAKKGFVSIIKEEIANDNIPGDPIEKRYFYLNTLNADGTAGKTFVYFLYKPETEEAWFYNTEPESVDAREDGAEQKKLNALQDYLKANFNAYFIIRFDIDNLWAEADVFKLTNGDLVASKVMVYKQGNSPIAHLNIV